MNSPITGDDVLFALLEVKTGRAEGVDGVISEVLSRGGEGMRQALTRLFQKAWETEQIPDLWTKGIICPLLKDGDKRNTQNYRGITVLSCVGKVYAYILNRRLIAKCEGQKVLVEEQCGFRPRRGCPDQLFTLVEVLKNRGKNGTFCCFIDVKKAFDRVFRGGLWVRLWAEGIKGKMSRVLKNLMRKVESCVRINGELSEWIKLETGVRQGCVLSPLLYALFINGLVKKLRDSKLGVPNPPRTLELGNTLFLMLLVISIWELS